MDKKSIGLKIKELREKHSLKIGKKYTGQMLADDLGISRSFIGDIESGRSTPSVELLKKICSIFDVTLEYFNELPDNDADIRRIQRARKKMPVKDREKMMKILEASFDDYFDDED